MSAALELEDVSVTLGDACVLDGVSLSVPEGELLGLVGPNGAGKTTLVEAVNGVRDPDSGRVRVDGREATTLSARERSRLLATVPQDTSVRFDLSVTDLVAMGRTPYRGRFQTGWDETDREHVERALARTALSDLRDRSVGAVSGGERQRAYVARALAQDAPVLLCDEPTASLDVNHQVSVLELLDGLAADGRTVVAAIHDLTLAARFCDRLALLSDGAVRASGTPESVLESGAVDAAFGTRTTVTPDPVTGTPTVTAHERPTDERDGHVHVLGGGRVGARVLGTVTEAGYDVTVGPLHEGDFALETARSLGVEATTVPPLETLPKDASATVSERVDAADAVVVADAGLDSEGRLLDIVARASGAVFVESRPLHERTDGDATARRRYERHRDRGRTASVESVPEAIEAVTSRPEATADD